MQLASARSSGPRASSSTLGGCMFRCLTRRARLSTSAESRPLPGCISWGCPGSTKKSRPCYSVWGKMQLFSHQPLRPGFRTTGGGLAVARAHPPPTLPPATTCLVTQPQSQNQELKENHSTWQLLLTRCEQIKQFVPLLHTCSNI